MTGAATKKESIWQLVRHSWGHLLHAAYASILIATYFLSGLLNAENAKVFIAYISVFVYVFVLLGILIYTLFRNERYIKDAHAKYDRAIQDVSSSVQDAQLRHERDLKEKDCMIASLGREARYAQAVLSIRNATQSLNDAHWYVGTCYQSSTPVDHGKLTGYLQPALDEVASAIGIVTGAKHRACIKLIDKKAGGLITRTLCRDHASAAVSREKDRTEGDIHTVQHNTAYRLIIHSNLPYFLCQNIPAYSHYENTSRKQFEGKELPYKGCIVVPIRHTLDHRDPTVTNTDPDADKTKCFGFLGVDCAATDVYSEKYDVGLLFAFADALFWVLYQWEVIEQLMENRTEPQVQRAANE